MKYCLERQLVVHEWRQIEISSRKDLNQRGIESLIKDLRSGDVLVVSEISRLARSVGEIAEIFDRLLNNRIRVICIKENLDLVKSDKNDLDIQSQVCITMFSLFAQIERSLISQRTKEGLMRAKANGKKLGNPKLKNNLSLLVQQADDFALSLKHIIEGFKLQKMTQRQMVDGLNSLGIKTRRGGTWGLLQLQNLIRRLDELDRPESFKIVEALQAKKSRRRKKV